EARERIDAETFGRTPVIVAGDDDGAVGPGEIGKRACGMTGIERRAIGKTIVTLDPGMDLRPLACRRAAKLERQLVRALRPHVVWHIRRMHEDPSPRQWGARV